MNCSRCLAELTRTIPAYWSPSVRLCTNCCAVCAERADEAGWPKAADIAHVAHYFLTPDLTFIERVVPPDRAIATCAECGDDSTTLVAGERARCIMTPGCKGRRVATP